MENFIYIEGVIGQDVTLASVRSQVEALKNPTEITVRINSGGGEVDMGFAIYDYLRSLNIKVNTEVMGMCGSIATIIQQAASNGGERTIHQNSKDFIHNPYWQNNAPIPMEARDAKDLYESLLVTENRILDFYVKHTKIEASVLKAKMDAQTELTAQEAKDLNLVDRIISSDAMSLRSYKVIALIKTEKQNTMANELKKEIQDGFAAVGKMLASLLKPKFVNVKTSEGVDIFYDGELTEGSKVWADEAMTVPAPDGIHTVGDKVYTVTGGVVTKVEDVVVNKTDLELANEKIAALETQLAAKDGEVAAAKAEVTQVVEAAKKIETEFVALKNQIVTGGKEIFNTVVDKPTGGEAKKTWQEEVIAMRKAEAERKANKK